MGLGSVAPPLEDVVANIHSQSYIESRVHIKCSYCVPWARAELGLSLILHCREGPPSSPSEQNPAQQGQKPGQQYRTRYLCN
jgi:hypothetical protein